MEEKRNNIKPQRIFLLLFIIFIVPTLTRFIENTQITLTELAYYLVNSVILTGYLAWLIPKIHLSRRSLTVLLWLELLVVQFLNNFVEALFFTDRFSRMGILAESIASALVASVISAVAGALLLGRGTASIETTLRDHLATRKTGSWIWRMAVGSIAYFPIYFFFGALITPFVLPYYNNPSFGLRIPPFAVLIPVELFRGFVYTLVLFPLLAATVGDRTTKFIMLAATLYVPGALIALLGNTLLPAQIIPFHALEILADSIVYGLVLSRILSKAS